MIKVGNCCKILPVGGESSEWELAGDRVRDMVDTLSTLWTVLVLPALSFFFLRLFVLVRRLLAVFVLVATDAPAGELSSKLLTLPKWRCVSRGTATADLGRFLGLGGRPVVPVSPASLRALRPASLLLLVLVCELLMGMTW